MKDASTVEPEAITEPERRRISDFLGDLSRLEGLLEAERKQNEELRAEVQYQRRRIEREEEVRIQLMQLLDNSQRLLGNSQRHVQLAMGGNASEIYSIEPPPAEPEPEEVPAAVAPPEPKRRRRWWGRF